MSRIVYMQGQPFVGQTPLIEDGSSDSGDSGSSYGPQGQCGHDFTDSKFDQDVNLEYRWNTDRNAVAAGHNVRMILLKWYLRYLWMGQFNHDFFRSEAGMDQWRYWRDKGEEGDDRLQGFEEKLTQFAIEEVAKDKVRNYATRVKYQGCEGMNARMAFMVRPLNEDQRSAILSDIKSKLKKLAKTAREQHEVEFYPFGRSSESAERTSDVTEDESDYSTSSIFGWVFAAAMIGTLVYGMYDPDQQKYIREPL